VRKKLPTLLPLLQVCLGLGLGLWGVAQAKDVLRGAVIYDYVPAPDFVSQLINLPATILTAGIFRKWTFQIGPAFSWVTFSLYLVFVAVLWYLVGLRIARRAAASTSISKFGFSPIGIVMAAVVFLMGIILIHSALGYFVSLSALLWSLVIVFLSKRQSRSSTATP
jgi:cbb3-type cytochrome oxidase subunit 3